MPKQKPKKYPYVVSIGVDEQTKIRLWEYIKRTRISTAKALSEVVREALKEYLDRHQKDQPPSTP
jgi:predicted DNA-binding protein (UPF0251 family)